MHLYSSPSRCPQEESIRITEITAPRGRATPSGSATGDARARRAWCRGHRHEEVNGFANEADYGHAGASGGSHLGDREEGYGRAGASGGNHLGDPEEGYGRGSSLAFDEQHCWQRRMACAQRA